MTFHTDAHQIVGNLGRDATTGVTREKGVPFLRFSLASTRGADTTWYNVTMFGDRTAKLAPLLTKGMKVAVFAHSLTLDNSYTPEGEKCPRPSINIIAQSVDLMSGRREEAPEVAEAVVDDLDDEIDF
jgi:single-stranded DNA-binding protein